MSETINSTHSRRDFIRFLTGSVATSSVALNSSCGFTGLKNFYTAKNIGLKHNISEDQLTLADGLNFNILIQEGDALNDTLFFGTNNDFIQIVKLKNNKTGLWVNHEAFSSVLASGRSRNEKPTLDQFKFERTLLGGSFFEIKMQDGNWEIVKNSLYNTRLSAESKIAFSNHIKIAGSDHAVGTLANCSGGLTPWNTILTCEENYQHYYGEYDRKKKSKSKVIISDKSVEWHRLEGLDPRHYGWVVEFDPETKRSKKLVGLGRFSHECAKPILNKDGYTVVYSGDDSDNECLYKFISSKKGSLDSGELFVASLEEGRWISLDINKSEILKKSFYNQEEVLTFCREASKLVGGTPLARPEDIEIDSLTGHIFVALTNNKTTNNYFGSILKIIEPKNNYASSRFEHEVFLTGGPKSGLSCPDNLAFDKKGNLWITSDISGGNINRGIYKGFGHNGLFVIPRKGKNQGQLLQMASAPTDAEFTGPCFSDDGKTLFLSVQHPGELSPKKGPYTSNWPDGSPNSKPLSAVVTITGPLLDRI